MRLRSQQSIRVRLTRWYIGATTGTLIAFAAIVFAFQYSTLKRQIVHDEIQDVVTVEGLLYLDSAGVMHLRQDYFSRPQSHMLIDRLMEVRDLGSNVVYRSDTLQGQALGGAVTHKEGDGSFNERVMSLPDGSRVLVISHIHGIHGKDFVIRIGYSLAPLQISLWQFLTLLLIVLVGMILLTVFSGNAVTRRVLSPLEFMATRAEGISARNLQDRLAITNPQDELGALAAAFNRLLERLEQTFQQLQRFTADAAHELRTPLAAVRTIGEVTLSSPRSEGEYGEAISSILEETARLNETIESLLLLARVETASPAEVESVPLASLMDEVLAVFAVLAEERGIRFHNEDKTGGNARVRAERALLRVALMNVVYNAIKFSPNSAVIRTLIDVSPEQAVCIWIDDQGPGVSRDEAEQIFNRFYTGRASQMSAKKGTGLGLSIARLIVERAGGEIAFDLSIDHGARCILKFPRDCRTPRANA